MKYFFGVVVLFSLPLFAFAEEVTSFVSDIYLNENGTFIVMETVEYDFGSADRHGIYRDILKQHPQGPTSSWKERYLDIDIQGVSLNGATVPYSVHESSEKVSVKIGDPKRTINGAHTYVISYLVRGGYSYFDDHTAELYWNATGNEWVVPITRAQVNLRANTSLFKDDTACYKGPYGSNIPCDSVTKSEDGIITFTATNLGVGENLTIGQQLDGTQLQILVLEKWKWWLMGILILQLLLIIGVFLGYRYKTAYKTGRPIIAQYEPYENFKPMYAGMFLDGRLDPRDITAGLVDLAEQGYIKIRNIDRKVLFIFDVDDYEITLLRNVADIVNDTMRDLALLIFELQDGPGTIVSLSDLRQKQSKQIENAQRLQRLRKDLKTDMKQNRFYQVNELLGKVLAANAVAFVALFVLIDILPSSLLILLFVATLLVGLVGLFMYERRTRRGYEALDYLKGFKLFLSVTDEERFKFHNAPQKSPEQFMKYLPYAIAFGVEKEWAEVFKDITIPDPTWYDGGNAGHFSAVGLTNSLGAFSTAMAASSVSSSSSSGGSGGGGFSGGGGGGGGGGSW